MQALDLALLTDAARAAGEMALRHWRRDPEAWDKPGGEGPVSEADLAVNRMLEAELRGARPDYGWLSEESADTSARQGAERVFIVDPIDGTRAFLAGETHFAHSLAVAERGQVVAAVVYLPALDLLYTAGLSAPALRDGQPIRASARGGIEGAQLLATRPAFEAGLWPGGVPDLRRAFRASLAYRMCLVAEGATSGFDGMVTFRDTWEWDIAAGALIAGRAGAVVTDRDGGAIAFNRPDPRAPGVISAAPGLHRALIARRGLDADQPIVSRQ